MNPNIRFLISKFSVIPWDSASLASLLPSHQFLDWQTKKVEWNQNNGEEAFPKLSLSGQFHNFHKLGN